MILTALSTLYSFFVEKDIVYVGKRKLLAKRIETEFITISTRTEFPSRSSRKANTTSSHQPPQYSVTIQFVRSSNGGKSLIAKGNVIGVRGYNEFFDEEGTMDQERFEKWLAELVEDVMQRQE